MKGKYTGTTVIKPCVDDPIIVPMRTSTLEPSLFPRQYTLDCPFRLQNAFSQGHIFEETLVSSILDPLAGMQISEMNHKLLKNKQELYNYDVDNDKKFEFFLYKLKEGHIVDIAKERYRGNIIGISQHFYRFIECGKYLVVFTGEIDLLDSNFDIIDIKYYSQFGERGLEEYDVYTLENYKDSVLQKKMQWFTYPRLMNDGNKKFYYDVYPKTKNKPTKNKPDNHLKYAQYVCDVDYELAEQEVRKNIIRYFQLCKDTGTTPGEKVSFD